MPDAEPQAPLGQLARLGSALARARDVDEVVGCLVLGRRALPEVLRVCVALSEGGGRRLRYTASDRDHAAGLDWCHIDAYDDVPLTSVVRTGRSVLHDRAELDRWFPAYAARQAADVLGLAAVALPGPGSPVGGILLLLARPWGRDHPQWRLLEATARRTSDAVRRVRVHQVVVPADPEQDDAARLILDDDPRSAGRARRFLRDLLAERGGVGEDAADTAQLCLSELVTNALVHAGGAIELRVTLVGTVLTVTVRDHGAVGGPISAEGDRGSDQLPVHGRGLQLVEVLAERWGSERDAHGSTVWFELRVDGSCPAAVGGCIVPE